VDRFREVNDIAPLIVIQQGEILLFQAADVMA